ncbi:MAG: DUF4330 domain-containing protein [Clostridia bacterium]|nr:DUF4330 domain-containing protein [Clostridia bacterium]
MKKKFNIIDLIVIVFLCAVILFVAHKFSHNTIVKDNNNNTDILYTLKIEDIMDLTVKAVPDSGNIYDKDGNALGRIIKKDVSNAEKIKVKADGHYTKAIIPDKFDVLLTVEANAVIKNEGYFIEGKKNIGSGSELTVKAPDIEFLAHVIEITDK